jgi:phycoerythrin-associated linker protein
MAFVTAAPLATTTFAGRSVASCVASRPAVNVTVARLGNGTSTGNSALDRLMSEKNVSERYIHPEPSRSTAGYSADMETLIQGIYRQIFGNAYIMESERAAMAKDESMFRDGQLSVKEFCRALGKTEEYMRRFVYGRPTYGVIELSFKHFLGRTPDGLEQYRAKSAIYDAQGYNAMVDAFFDDGEYDQAFDEWCAPFVRGHLSESNLSMAAFTHLFQVVRGASTSDKANIHVGTGKIPLNRAGIQSIPLPIVYPGSEGAAFQSPDASSGSWQNGFSGISMARHSFGQIPQSSNSGDKMFRIEVTGFNQASANNGRSGVTLRSRSGKVYGTRNNSAGPKLSSFRRSNRVYVVPFSELSATYVKIHKDGGKIASLTPVGGG